MSTTSEIVERLRGVRGAMLDWAQDFRRVGSADGEMSEKSRAALLGEAASRIEELENALETIETVADNERLEATDAHYAVILAGIQSTARAARKSGDA
jgi:hypothetical protein